MQHLQNLLVFAERGSCDVALRLTVQPERKLNDGDNRFSNGRNCVIIVRRSDQTPALLTGKARRVLAGGTQPGRPRNASAALCVSGRRLGRRRLFHSNRALSTVGPFDHRLRP